LFENVKGLWRTAKHREFFERMKNQLHNAGYVTSERLINCIEYGVPQNRERIILEGFQKKMVNKASYNAGSMTISDGYFPWEKHTKYTLGIFQKPWPTTNSFVQDSVIECPKGIVEELTVQYWFNRNDVNNHPNSKHHFIPRQGLRRFMAIDEGDDSKKSYKRLHRWRYSPTACYGNNEVHLHPYKPRRLSVAEALAIQSLPQGFQLPNNMTLTNMFKTVGNGVPYLASMGLAKSLLDFLGVDNSEIDSI